jgi:hypothetical protein
MPSIRVTNCVTWNKHTEFTRLLYNPPIRIDSNPF